MAYDCIEWLCNCHFRLTPYQITRKNFETPITCDSIFKLPRNKKTPPWNVVLFGPLFWLISIYYHCDLTYIKCSKELFQTRVLVQSCSFLLSLSNNAAVLFPPSIELKMLPKRCTGPRDIVNQKKTKNSNSIFLLHGSARLKKPLILRPHFHVSELKYKTSKWLSQGHRVDQRLSKDWNLLTNRT